jgi:hypothetical protein
MPRNMTGGSGHRSQRNSEGNKARNNRIKGDLLLDDLFNEEEIDGVLVGKVTRRLGCGRMEICHFNEKGEAFLMQAPLRGGMRGKGKKSVWVDIGSVVIVAETDLSGKTHEIIAVMTPEQLARYRVIMPKADARLFVKDGNTEETAKDEIVFDEDHEDVDVDAI